MPGTRATPITEDNWGKAIGAYALTPPYFQDGSIDTLPKAVRIVAKIQLDENLPEGDVHAIVRFLGSLTGPTPEGFDRPPLLPV